MKVNEAPEYRTVEALRKRAEEAFSSTNQQCSALCRDLRATDAKLTNAEMSGASPEKIKELKARFLALSDRLKALDCPDCALP